MKKFILAGTIFVMFMPLVVFASTSTELLYTVNQKVCNRFEEDVVRLAAIMEELRSRKGITETRVAFGGIDTQIKNADYWITYAAEAVAFQKAQKYDSKNELKGSLEVLKNKILKAKREVGNALEE